MKAAFMIAKYKSREESGHIFKRSISALKIIRQMK